MTCEMSVFYSKKPKTTLIHCQKKARNLWVYKAKSEKKDAPSMRKCACSLISLIGQTGQPITFRLIGWERKVEQDVSPPPNQFSCNDIAERLFLSDVPVLGQPWWVLILWGGFLERINCLCICRLKRCCFMHLMFPCLLQLRGTVWICPQSAFVKTLVFYQLMLVTAWPYDVSTETVVQQYSPGINRRWGRNESSCQTSIYTARKLSSLVNFETAHASSWLVKTSTIAWSFQIYKFPTQRPITAFEATLLSTSFTPAQLSVWGDRVWTLDLSVRRSVDRSLARLTRKIPRSWTVH